MLYNPINDSTLTASPVCVLAILLQILTRPLQREGEGAIPEVISTMQVRGGVSGQA